MDELRNKQNLQGYSVKNRITLLFTITDLEMHGVQHQLMELVKGLDKERFRPIILNFKPGGPMEGEYRKIPGIRLISLKRKGKYDFLFLFKVFNLIRKMKVDVIQPFLTPATFFSLLPALFCHTPVKIVTERNSINARINGGFGYHLYIKAEEFLSRFSDLAVANSESGRECLIERGIATSRARTIYNGINIDNYTCDSRVVERVRQKLAVPQGGKVVGMVARMFPFKRYDVFLQAAAIINKTVPNTRYALLGDGPLRSNLENLSHELGMASKVTFFGEQHDVATRVSAFDIFTLISETEGLSLSICEAMALGKPVVATDVGGNKELVEDGKTGFLIPLGDTEALANAIIRLLQDPELAQAMGQKAREKIATQFGLERYVNEYQNLYEETLRQKKSISSRLDGTWV
jgi:glycosyltransferase involved in cell wall biosynthesis